MGINFTRRGYIRLFRDGIPISQHTAAEEAYERALEHAETHGDGKYIVTYPDREIDVNLLMLSRVRGGATISGGGSGDTVTITGSGFGSKSVAAPHFFQPFDTTTQGDDYAEAGFDFLGGNSSLTANNYVDMAATLHGNGSWRTNSIAAETFSHFGKLMPASNDRVYCSFWRRFHTISAGTDGAQIKGTRCGSAGGFTGSSDGDEMYGQVPKFSTSDLLNFSDPSNSDEYCVGHWWSNSSGEQSIFDPSGTGQKVLNDSWHFVECYYQMNTLGNANGILQRATNNVLYHSVSNIEMKLSAGEYLDYCQPNPGWANSFDAGSFNVFHSRIYIDNSRARAFLGNASTLAACTAKYLIPASSWSDTQVVGAKRGTIPSGYDWAYVTTTSGSTNSSGLSYSLS